jgi:hypothetical protein
MRGRASLSSAFVAGLAVLGCHTITELPSVPTASPTPGVLTPIQIPVTNVPTPPPTPTPPPATPPPPPTSTPTPTPTSTPPPGGQIRVLCSPAYAPDGLNCPKNPNPAFVDDVEAAIMKLVREQPQLFSGYNVLDRVAYYNGVFQNLYDAGFCAAMDAEEVAVSTIANRHDRENYQILTSMGKYRTGPNSHISACHVP